jgi:hypothetical protein
MVLAGLAACGGPPASAPTPSPAPQSSTPSSALAAPASIAGFRLTSTGPVRGAPTDTTYRYAMDDTSVHVTAFRYHIAEYARVAPDSQAWTVREGSGFINVFPILKARGGVDAFEIAETKTSVVRIGNRDIAEHMMTVAVRMRGLPMVEEQFIYIVRGKFLKVRATMPADRYPARSAQAFARALAQALETGQRP